MKTIEQKAKRVPAIRFAGFDDEWVEKKIFDVAEIVGGGTPSTANPQFWDGNIDWYAPAEINDQVFVNGSERKITKLGLENSSAKVLPANRTVLFTSRAGIGKTAILQSPAATNQGFQSLVLNDDTDTYFVYSMTDKIKAKAERIASGSTFAEISGKMLGNLELVFPSKKEQSKIGSFFSNVDSLISLEQKKYDKLTQVKKSMLEKMFPKEGATVPEVRFAGFSGDWVWKELDDIIVRIATGLNPRDNFKLNSGGSNYYVTIKNFEHGHLYLDEKCDRIDDCALQLIQARSDLQKDDLLFSSIGRIGDCYLIKNNPQNWNINESVFTLRPNKAIVASNYLFHVVHCDIVLSQILDSVTGSTFKSIKIGDLKKALIPIPCKEEQIQIANYLDNLDSLISLQQRKLEKLKNIKKSLLEKMFV